MKSQIVVCIPTNFQNRREVAAALTDRYGAEYVFMGRVFCSTTTADSCAIDICDRQAVLHLKLLQNKTIQGSVFDSQTEVSLADDFELAATTRIDLVTRQQINRSEQIIYLTADRVGYDACLQIARLAEVLLAIGGIAIKVESTGIAHSRSKWLANYDSDDVFEIQSLYVRLIEGEYYYSCGMHNFGKADVAISLDVDIGLAIYVMNVFNYYRLTESPILQDGHTFQPDVSCDRYQIKWIEDDEETPDSLLHNPYGRWLLVISN